MPSIAVTQLENYIEEIERLGPSSPDLKNPSFANQFQLALDTLRCLVYLCKNIKEFLAYIRTSKQRIFHEPTLNLSVNIQHYRELETIGIDVAQLLHDEVNEIVTGLNMIKMGDSFVLNDLLKTFINKIQDSKEGYMQDRLDSAITFLMHVVNGTVAPNEIQRIEHLAPDVAQQNAQQESKQAYVAAHHSAAPACRLGSTHYADAQRFIPLVQKKGHGDEDKLDGDDSGPGNSNSEYFTQKHIACMQQEKAKNTSMIAELQNQSPGSAAVPDKDSAVTVQELKAANIGLTRMIQSAEKGDYKAEASLRYFVYKYPTLLQHNLDFIEELGREFCQRQVVPRS